METQSHKHTHTDRHLTRLKDTDDHRDGHGNPPHLRILLHDLFDAALQERNKISTNKER